MPYLIAVLATAAAVAARWVLDPWLGGTLTLVTLYPAIALAVWAGGYGPALVTVLLGYLACDYAFIEPRGRFDWNNAQTLIGLAAYLVSSAIIVLFGTAMRAAERRSHQQTKTLETTFRSIGDGVITTDADGRITALNRTAESLTGWTEADALGQPIESVFRIVNDTTRQPVDNPAARALREGMVVDLANHTVLIRRDGSERTIDDSAAPIRTSAGDVEGCVLVFRDVGDRRRFERQADERLSAARLLAAIVTSSDDAIVSKTAEGIIQTWNKAAERLFGHSAEEAIGQSIALIVPPDRLAEEAWIMAELRAGRRVDHFDTVRVDRHGQLVDVAVTISPLVDDRGEFIGASKIARNITSQKIQQKRIDDLMAALRMADRRKDQFLATLAHELRSPLAPLRSALEIIRRSPGNAEVLSQSIDTMDRQLAQMARLVDDLLDVERITLERLELRKVPVDLAGVVGQAVETARSFADRGQLELVSTLPPEKIVVDGDPTRLAQIIGNLLSNACKYTNPGGRVSLRVDRGDRDVTITVSDTGIGIDAEVLPRVFDLFVQGEEVIGRAQGGLGIGLTLVKRLVEMHSGSVEAASDGPGRGSTFTVRLPLLNALQAARSAPGPRLMPSAGRRFLVVDDNVDGAETLTLLLTLTGHEARMAHDGPQAIEMARDFQPDVVLLDLGLPTLSGFDVCRRIRGEAFGQKMLLVALTGWGQPEDRQKSRDAGFDAHVVKPVDHEALMALLASIPPR